MHFNVHYSAKSATWVGVSRGWGCSARIGDSISYSRELLFFIKTNPFLSDDKAFLFFKNYADCVSFAFSHQIVDFSLSHHRSNGRRLSTAALFCKYSSLIFISYRAGLAFFSHREDRFRLLSSTHFLFLYFPWSSWICSLFRMSQKPRNISKISVCTMLKE